MDKNYNVDDILEEIKRKKSRRETGASLTSAQGEYPHSSYTPRSERTLEEDETPTYSGYFRPGAGSSSKVTYGASSASNPRRQNWQEEEYYEESRRSSGRQGRVAPPPRRSRTNDEIYEEYEQEPQRVSPRQERFAPPRRQNPTDDGIYEAYEQEPRRASTRQERSVFQPPQRRGEDLDYEEQPQQAPLSEKKSFGQRRSKFGGDREVRPADSVSREARWEEQEDLTQWEEPEEETRSRFAFHRSAQAQREPVSVLSGKKKQSRGNLAAAFGDHGSLVPPEEEEPDFEENFNRAKANRQPVAYRDQPEQRTVQRPVAVVQDRALDYEEDTSSTRIDMRIPQLDEDDLQDSSDVSQPPKQKGKKKAKREKNPPQEPENQDDLFEDFPQEIDDYNRPADAGAILKDIRSIKFGLFIRLFVTTFCFGWILYFAFALDNLKLPLFFFMLPDENMRAFIGTSLGLLLLSTLFCNTTVGGGLMSLFKMKADGDSPVALAVLASIAQGVALIAFPEMVGTTGVHYYFAITALGLVFNTLGKLFMIFRIQRNFAMIAPGKAKRYGVMTIQNRALARELTRGSDLKSPVIAYSAQGEFFTNFLELSYTEDYGENLSRITTPLFFVFTLVASVVAYFLSGDPFATLTAFTALMCICAPFTTTITGNLPLLRMSGKLTANGAMVAGFTALDHFDDINGLMVGATELFPAGTILLHGIKSFDQKRIDEAILDAASVICKCDGALASVFLKIIGNQERILKEVDSLVYEDGMGLSAWVGGKRVLIGNRELMHHHSIDTPSQDYEKKFTKDGRELLYLSNSGELTAMFILSYHQDADISDALDSLARRDITLLIHTTDPNITPEKMEEVYGYPADLVRMVPAKVHEEYYQMTAPRERIRSEFVYDGTILSKLRAIRGILSAKGAILLGTILQGIGMLLGYGAVAYFAFTGSIDSVTFELLLTYQTFWALMILLLPSLRRY